LPTDRGIKELALFITNISAAWFENLLPKIVANLLIPVLAYKGIAADCAKFALTCLISLTVFPNSSIKETLLSGELKFCATFSPNVKSIVEEEY